MKNVAIMGKAKSGKSVLLADFLKDSKSSVLFPNFTDCVANELPKLVLDFNDGSLIKLIQKNRLTENVFIAPNREVALELAISFNGAFILVLDQVSVTMNNHQVIDLAKELQLKYNEEMSILLTTSLGSHDEVNKKIIDRLRFSLGIEDFIELRVKDLMQEEAELLDLYTDKVVKTFKLSTLLKKYHEGEV